MENFDMNMYNALFPQTTGNSTVSPDLMPKPTNNITNNSTKNVAVQGLQQPLTAFPEKTPIAMAYVPYQMWEKPYDDVVGFTRGTIFPSLDKPFIGEEAVKNAR